VTVLITIAAKLLTLALCWVALIGLVWFVVKAFQLVWP
jgi:hypothetical protein